MDSLFEVRCILFESSKFNSLKRWNCISENHQTIPTTSMLIKIKIIINWLNLINVDDIHGKVQTVIKTMSWKKKIENKSNKIWIISKFKPTID